MNAGVRGRQGGHKPDKTPPTVEKRLVVFSQLDKPRAQGGMTAQYIY